MATPAQLANSVALHSVSCVVFLRHTVAYMMPSLKLDASPHIWDCSSVPPQLYEMR